MYLYSQELKLNLKNFIIWALSVGGMLLAVILIFDTMGDSADDLSEMFSNMGAFTSAFGMERVSIGTLPGYFAVEGSVIAGLGSAMYAALTGAAIVAKEEEGHTADETLKASPPVAEDEVARKGKCKREDNPPCVALAALHNINQEDDGQTEQRG